MNDFEKIFYKINNPIPLPDHEISITKRDKNIIGVLLFLLSVFRILYVAYKLLPISIVDYIILYCAITWIIWYFERIPILKKILFGIVLPLKITLYTGLRLLFSLRELMMCIFIGFIVFLLLVFVSSYAGVELNESTKIYLVMTISSIFITYVSDAIIAYAFVNESHNEDSIKSMLDGKRIKNLIFVVYFLGLLIANAAHFNQNNIIWFDEYLPAILQSFVTFIAFDRFWASGKYSTGTNHATTKK